MRILLLVHHFPPDVNSTGSLMARVGEGLVKAGHEVTVLTTLPHYADFRTWPEYRGKLAVHDTWNGIKVHRLYSYAPGTKSMRNRLANYLTFNMMAAGAGGLLGGGFDVVFATNGSFFTGLPAGFIGGRKVPFIFNLQDLYPHVPIQAGQLTNRQAIAVLRTIEQFMYRRAAHLAVITPAFRDYLLECGIPAERISVIPNFVDVDFIRPLPRVNAWSSANDLNDKFVVAHAGAVGYVYDLESLLLAADRLRHEDGIEFVIVGEGVAKPGLQKRAHELRLDNLRFLPYQPYEDLPEMRAAMDVQVALYTRDAARYSLPSKVYEIMASQRALLVSGETGSDLRRLADESGAGLGVEPGDVDGLVAAILRLRDDPEARNLMAEKGRSHAVSHYSIEAVTAQYESLMMRVGGGQRPRLGAARRIPTRPGPGTPSL